MNSAPLIAWAQAREALRLKKESGAPPPWTEDEFLARYRFCNLRRKDDRVSRWLRKYVLTSANLQLGFASFIEFTAFCRWNNWPPAIAEVMRRGLYPARKIDWPAVSVVLDELKANKQKAWTGAYMVNAAQANGRSKARFVTEAVIAEGIGGAISQLEKAFHTGSRREVWSTLLTLPGQGSFMAGQIVDDWGWTPLLAGAKDVYTWAPQGPGSIRGFNRLMGLPLRQRHKEEEWCTQLQVWRKEIIAALGRSYRTLTLMDTQNALCETDKWLRVKNGEGKPRSQYRPEKAYEA